MPIRLHTHDEIVCEVDEARADEAKALLRREINIIRKDEADIIRKGKGGAK
jgi:hypothetical protein